MPRLTFLVQIISFDGITDITEEVVFGFIFWLGFSVRTEIGKV
jgi:hypothetical protein